MQKSNFHLKHIQSFERPLKYPIPILTFLLPHNFAVYYSELMLSRYCNSAPALLSDFRSWSTSLNIVFRYNQKLQMT